MFDKDDFIQIDYEYFNVCSINAYHIILKSKNTGHIWDIESKALFMGKRSIIINHKHRESDRFHRQIGHPRTVCEAQEQIKKHDTFQMNNRQ